MEGWTGVLISTSGLSGLDDRLEAGWKEGEKEDLRRGPFVISREHRHVRPVTYRHVGFGDVHNTRTCCNWVWFCPVLNAHASVEKGQAGQGKARQGEASLDRSRERRRFVPPICGGMEARRMSSTCAMCEIRPLLLCPHTP